MNPSNLSLRQKSRGTVVKTIAIHLYGARDPNYIVDLTLSNLLWFLSALAICAESTCTAVKIVKGDHFKWL